MSILDYFPYPQPRPAQRELLLKIEKYWNAYDIFVVVAPTACHENGTKVLMHDGSIKQVEDVELGDKLMGPDSQPRVVVKLHSGVSPLLEIIPKRGNSWRVTPNHKLSLLRYTQTNHRAPKKWEHKKVVAEAREWFDWSKTRKQACC